MSSVSKLIENLRRLEAVMNNDMRVMTCGEAAFLLNKSANTITRYIAVGKLHKASGNGVNGVPAREVYKLVIK